MASRTSPAPGVGGAARRDARSGRRHPRGAAPSAAARHAPPRRCGSAEVDVELLGERVQHPAVGHRAIVVDRQVERPASALPGDVAAGLLGGRRHRQHHVGMLGDGAAPDLEADDEPGACQCLGGELRVARRRPGRHRRSPPRLASPGPARAGPRPGRGRAPPAGRHPIPARPPHARRRRSPGGRRAAGWATRRRRRHPARRRVAAPRPGARRCRAASAAAALNAPGELASRSPTRISAPSAAQRLGDRRRRASRARRPRAPGARAGSAPPPSFSAPWEANGAIVHTAVAPRRVDLRSRRKTIGDSSSGSKPDQQDRGCGLERRRRRRARGVRPATCAARNVELLGADPAARGSRCRWCRARPGRTSRRRRRPPR